MQKHRVTLHAGACGGGSSGGHVSLEICDVISGVTIMSISMDYATFGKLIGSNGYVSADAEIRGLECIGKKYVSEPRSVVCPVKFDGLKYEEVKTAQEKWLLDNCQEEGWKINAYLRSQGSIVRDYKTGTSTFNYTVFKYVDISDEECAELLAKKDHY